MSTRTSTRAEPGPAAHRVRPIAFRVVTFVVVFELVAGSVWNLVPIDWVEIQLAHLGYPPYFALLLGAWQAAAAAALVAPGLALLKEWAYAGVFLLWSGAVVSHLLVGDGVESWGPPLGFAVCAVASWALRPADDGTRRSWIAPVVLLAALYAVSVLTLPLAEEAMHQQAVERGWIAG